MRQSVDGGLVFGALGSALALLGLVMFVARWRRFARWQPTVGVVVGFRVRQTRRDGRRRTFYHPRVRYLAAGREWFLESSVSTSQPRREVGDAVAVLHDPARPEDACIDELSEKYFVAFVVGAIGLVFAAVPVLF